jgi:UDP-N-acetylmuramoylalanine--D-glutamate ligase
VQALKEYENVELVLGRHRMRDFQNKDFIIRPASAPLDSEYLDEAKENGIPVEIDETLFLKYAPEMTAIGVTGTRGKSTVTHMIAHILRQAYSKKDINVLLLGNVRGKAALPKLTEVKEGDIAVMELSSWQLQAFGNRKISPEIAVFTSFMEDHLDYYANDPDDPASRKKAMQRYFKDKSHIYKHQLPDDSLIISSDLADRIGSDTSFRAVSHIDFPDEWTLQLPGKHNRLNAALAIVTARECEGIDELTIRNAVENFTGIEGRLEYLGNIAGVKVYNDNNATTEDATVAGLQALQASRELTLICGGSDKQLSFAKLATVVKNHVDNLILLSGSGTEKMKAAFEKQGGIDWDEFDDFNEAIQTAFTKTSEEGTILFSPAAASFNMFESEHERNDRFKEIVQSKKLRDANTKSS